MLFQSSFRIIDLIVFSIVSKRNFWFYKASRRCKHTSPNNFTHLHIDKFAVPIYY